MQPSSIAQGHQNPAVGLHLLAGTAVQLANTPQRFPLSQAFVEAGVRSIAGDWLPEQICRLSPQRQAMVQSMLAHLASSAEAAPVLAGCSSVFRFKHLDKTLDGAVTVNVNGEVVGMLIRNPNDTGGQGAYVVKLEKPAASREPQPCEASTRKRLMNQLPGNLPSGSQPKRPATAAANQAMVARPSDWTRSDTALMALAETALAATSAMEATADQHPEPLDTKYKEIKLTALATDALEKTMTAEAFYGALLKLSAEEDKNAWREYRKTLQKFECSLKKKNKSLAGVMADFSEFASAAKSYLIECKDPHAKDILCRLCRMSFGPLPVETYVRPRIADPGSPFYHQPGPETPAEAAGGVRPTDDDKKIRRVQAPVSLVDIWIAGEGAESAAKFFKDPPREVGVKRLLEVFAELDKAYPGNNARKRFWPCLLVDIFDPVLGVAVLKAVNVFARTPKPESKTSKLPAGPTINSYMRIAIGLAVHACKNDISHEDFPKLLESGSVALATVKREMGRDSAQFDSAVSFISSNFKIEDVASMQAESTA